jgi:hypothetical protein
LKVNFVSLKDGIDLSTAAGRLIANVLASVASYETEVRTERIAAGKAAKQARIEAIIQAGGTPPVINKGGRPKGIPNKVTPTVATMILPSRPPNPILRDMVSCSRISCPGGRGHEATRSRQGTIVAAALATLAA